MHVSLVCLITQYWAEVT